MCQVETFGSHTCLHQWMTIVKPCGPQASFKDQYHQYKPVRSGLQRLTQPRAISAPAKSCPNCDRKGDYDPNLTRVILKNAQEAGNMGNGYNMTDGRGNVLHPVYQDGGMPLRASYTACGVSRVNAPRQSGCCIVM